MSITFIYLFDNLNEWLLRIEHLIELWNGILYGCVRNSGTFFVPYSAFYMYVCDLDRFTLCKNIYVYEIMTNMSMKLFGVSVFLYSAKNVPEQEKNSKPCKA